MRICNVMAVSLDGRIASHPHETDDARRSLGFTNAEDQAHLEALLKTADAVIVGSSSLSASGGAWEIRNAKGHYPIWAVLTNRGLPTSSRFFSQRCIKRWVVSRGPLKELAGTEIRNLTYDGESPGLVLVDELKAAGAERVLLFGGSEVNRIFYAQGLVDELIITVCPIILATSASLPLIQPTLPYPVRLQLTTSHSSNDLVFLTYNVLKN